MKLRNGKVILQICSATWGLLPRKLPKEVDDLREQTLLPWLFLQEREMWHPGIPLEKTLPAWRQRILEWVGRTLKFL